MKNVIFHLIVTFYYPQQAKPTLTMGNRSRFYRSTTTLVLTSLAALSTVVSLDIRECSPMLYLS